MLRNVEASWVTLAFHKGFHARKLARSEVAGLIGFSLAASLGRYSYVTQPSTIQA